MKKAFVITAAAALAVVIVVWFLAVSWKDIMYRLDPWSVLVGEWDVVRVERGSPFEWFGSSHVVCSFFDDQRVRLGRAGVGSCRASGRSLELEYRGLAPVRFTVRVEGYDSLVLRHVATRRHAWLRRRASQPRDDTGWQVQR